MRKLVRKIRNDHGAAAVEYALLVSLIAASIVTLVGTLGGKVAMAFQAIVNTLPN